MQKGTIRKIKTWAIILISVYVVSGVLVYFLQDQFLFHPRKLPREYAFDFTGKFNEINLPVNEEKNLNIVQFIVPDSLAKGVVLYFHGNRKNITRYALYADNFTKNNYEVWMVDYPGFGKSTGAFSEEAVYKDAALVYQMARAKFSKDNIVLYGKSLGTGIAAQLASIRDCRQLILETPYYSIPSLLKRYAFIYPVDWLCRYQFSTFEYLKKAGAPVTILHGTDDEIIPFSQAKKLVKENPAVSLVPIEGGRHNNLDDFPSFHQQLDSLLR